MTVWCYGPRYNASNCDNHGCPETYDVRKPTIRLTYVLPRNRERSCLQLAYDQLKARLRTSPISKNRNLWTYIMLSKTESKCSWMLSRKCYLIYFKNNAVLLSCFTDGFPRISLWLHRHLRAAQLREHAGMSRPSAGVGHWWVDYNLVRKVDNVCINTSRWCRFSSTLPTGTRMARRSDR